MTHEELLDKIEAIDYWQGHFANKTFLKALIAVLELHKPFNIDTDKPLCSRCMEPDLSHKENPILVMAPYPCPTIQVIDNALRS